jgi:hypothetical protein
MADDTEAVVDLDASAEELPGDNSVADLDGADDGQEGEGDESLLPEEHDETDGELNETEQEDEDGGGGSEAGDDEEEAAAISPGNEASAEQSLEQQSFDDPIAAQVRDAIFMVFESIDPEQPDEIFVKLAADVICKMICSGTPATSVGVALESDGGSLQFISLAEKDSEDNVEMSSNVTRTLSAGRGVLHNCLSQSATVAIPNVLDEPSVHFFTGSPRPGSLVAMPFTDESNTIRGVICMDSCAAQPAAPVAQPAPDHSQEAAALLEEAELLQAEADEVAADPDASEEDKQSAAASAQAAKEAAATALAAAQAAAQAAAAPPAPVGEDDAASHDAGAVLPATFSDDNISILEVMAHELSRAISMLSQRHNKPEAPAAAHLDSTLSSDAVPDSPEPAQDSFESPDGDYEEEEMDADALAACVMCPSHSDKV